MDAAWLIFIVSLPTHNTTRRMRVWRALKGMGCGVLRDGVYLLPNREGFRRVLHDYVGEVIADGGSAHVLVLNSADPAQQSLFEGLFDRSGEYAELMGSIRQAVSLELAAEPPLKLQKLRNRLRREFEAVVALDFFPGAAQEQAMMALEDFEHSITEVLTPDEPHAIHKRIKRLTVKDYQGRLWATRQRPWVDRLASAWLIRRFIDPEARFLWLASPADCPTEALGFDFDGAAFTHVGARVTFEVLLASFGLTQDTALNQLGALVHYLDVGGVQPPEAVGVEVTLSGLRNTIPDDDALLSVCCAMFDGLLMNYQQSNSEKEESLS